MPKLTFGLLLLLVLPIPACDDDDDGPGGVPGIYIGTADSENVAGPPIGFTAILSQDGTAVSGNAAIPSPCFSSTDIKGALKGSSLTGELVSDENHATITLEVRENGLEGRYKVDAGKCSGDVGTITFER